ncbi:MAG: hypothetical protein JO111_05490 [Caulobacteraceae bacterium]|nr:hypothetical protein [Caulobacteraceae bacterium]
MIDLKASQASSRDEEIMSRTSRTSPSLLWSVAAALIAVAASAEAGPIINVPWLGPPGQGPQLTQDDITRLKAAIDRLNEGRSVGTVERWRSETSKNAGEVALTRIFVAKGMSCHTIRNVVRYGSRPDAPRSFVFNWCRQPDGQWKIVELDH